MPGKLARDAKIDVVRVLYPFLSSLTFSPHLTIISTILIVHTLRSFVTLMNLSFGNLALSSCPEALRTSSSAMSEAKHEKG